MSNPIYWFITKPADSETAKKNKKTGQHPYRKRGSIAMAIILLGVVLGVFAGLIPDGLKEELTQFAGYIRLSYTHFWLISFLGLTSILLIFVWWEAKINVREEVVEKSRPSVLPTKKQLIPNESDSFTPIQTVEPNMTAMSNTPDCDTLTIFIACSNELKRDKDQLKLALVQKTNDLRDAHNIKLEVKSWEDLPQGLRGTDRTQDNYNDFIRTCDAVIVLYWTKLGQFTQEEFELALDISKKPNAKTTTCLYQCNRPVKPSEVDHTSLAWFEERFTHIFRYPYESIDTAIFKFVETELPGLINEKARLNRGN